MAPTLCRGDGASASTGRRAPSTAAVPPRQTSPARGRSAPGVPPERDPGHTPARCRDAHRSPSPWRACFQTLTSNSTLPAPSLLPAALPRSGAHWLPPAADTQASPLRLRPQGGLGPQRLGGQTQTRSVSSRQLTARPHLAQGPWRLSRQHLPLLSSTFVTRVPHPDRLRSCFFFLLPWVSFHY